MMSKTNAGGQSDMGHKVRSNERMRREKKKRKTQERAETRRVQAEKLEKQRKRIRRWQTILMPVGILLGMMLAGLIRKIFGEAIPHTYMHMRPNTLPTAAVDPLVFVGLLAGCAAGIIMGKIAEMLICNEE